MYLPAKNPIQHWHFPATTHTGSMLAHVMVSISKWLFIRHRLSIYLNAVWSLTYNTGTFVVWSSNTQLITNIDPWSTYLQWLPVLVVFKTCTLLHRSRLWIPFSWMSSLITNESVRTTKYITSQFVISNDMDSFNCRQVTSQNQVRSTAKFMYKLTISKTKVSIHVNQSM